MESQKKLLGLTRRKCVASSASALATGGLTAAFARDAQATGVPPSEPSDRQGRRAAFRVRIDTDPGVDDALALLLAMRSPQLKIEAITPVDGNVPLDLTLPNALRM